MWELGNYARIAKLIAGMGRELVAAADVHPGQRVLDVAAGTGNAAIPAARAGADVTALDLTPRLLDLGRRAAGHLPIDWVEGDAADLPFADGEFDVVLSAVGAMFAADHEATARELVRVCRPGGLVALANWTPDGGLGRFFRLLDRYQAARPGGPAGPESTPPPLLWGDPGHLRGLFGGRPMETERRLIEYGFTGTAAELAELYRTTFPPVVATRDTLGPDRRAAFDHDLDELLTAENQGPAGGQGRWRFPWLLVRLRMAGAAGSGT